MTDVPAADATLRLLRHLSRTGPLPAAALASALDLPFTDPTTVLA